MVVIALLVANIVGCSTPSSTLQKQGDLQLVNECSTTVDEFLNRLDEGRYREALEKPLSQIQMGTEEYFKRTMNSRASMGKVIMRTYLMASHLTEMPGMPDGEYLVMFYQTEFENKKKSTESVFLKKDSGSWVVFSYRLL